MKTAVIYWSSTGNTEAMAKAIAEAAGSDLFSVSDFKGKISDYDRVAFGCSAMPDNVVVGIPLEHVLPEHRAAPILLVAAYLGVACMLACHKGATAGCTHGTSRVGLREAHTLSGHAVYARCRDILLAIASEVAVAHIVAHYIYNVRVIRPCKGQGRQSANQW